MERGMARVLIAAALLGGAVLATGCASGPPADNGGAPDSGGESLATLAAWMTGSFSSAAQAGADRAYSDIRLEMAPIWTERTDGAWLYVEQAVATALDKPYRQRVYHLLAQPDGSIRLEVFALPGTAMTFAGAYRYPEAAFAGVKPEQLRARDGCSITLRRTGAGEFAGSTNGTDCPSDRDGAAYATSDVTVSALRMTTLDRGFDKNGKQVWGAAAGGYVFDRVGE